MKKYRYVLKRDDFNGSDSDWERLHDYATHNFEHVVCSSKAMYFNATACHLDNAANKLRIGTTGFAILTTSTLDPSVHE